MRTLRYILSHRFFLHNINPSERAYLFPVPEPDSNAYFEPLPDKNKRILISYSVLSDIINARPIIDRLTAMPELRLAFASWTPKRHLPCPRPEQEFIPISEPADGGISG